MHAAVVVLVLALAEPNAPDPGVSAAPPTADSGAIAKITREMNAVIAKGKPQGEPKETLCARIQPIWEAGRRYRDSADEAFRLARAVFAHKRRKDWGCPLGAADKADPNTKASSLWDRFEETRRNLEKASSREERARRQESLRWAAVALLHELSPSEGRYQQVVDSLALTVASKDSAATLQAIVASIEPGDLAGDKGKAIADAVSKLARDIPPTAFGKDQIDSLIGFAIRIAKENPTWLQQESAGQFLEITLRSMAELPPGKLTDTQAAAVFDFTAKLLARDPRWLEGGRSAILADLVPHLLERVDVAKVKNEDLGIVLEFTVKVMAGRPDWPEQMRNIIDQWDQILQIAIETKNPATRAMIQKAVAALQKREGDAWKPLADEVAKQKPDPQAVTSLLKALGVARMEEIRREQAALADEEVVDSTFQRLSTLIGMRLPDDCDDRRRGVSPACDAVFAFADAFREHVVPGRPEGADLLGVAITTSVADALARAECTLLPPAPPRPGEAPCQGLDPRLKGAFASFVALEVVRVAGERPSFAGRAGCVVVSAKKVVDRVDQVGEARFVEEGEPRTDVTIAAEGLAEQALRRCTLSRPYSDFATELLTKGKVAPDVNASSALLFAGLPYLRDARTPGLARAFSAADFATLVTGAGGLAAGIYLHNTNDGPWGDRMLRVGVVSLGVNVLVKLGATAYYAVRYGGTRP